MMDIVPITIDSIDVYQTVIALHTIRTITVVVVVTIQMADIIIISFIIQTDIAAYCRTC